MKTFNRRGDGGETSLLFGLRVPKSDPHCEAYGAVDEVVAALGLARALSGKGWVQDILLRIQKDLFVLAAELATPPEMYSKLTERRQVISGSEVQRLEDFIVDIEKAVEMPRSFIVPGNTPASAAIHLARTIVRRAERRVVSLHRGGKVPNVEILRYLNRLADLLFALGWYEEVSPTGGVGRGSI